MNDIDALPEPWKSRLQKTETLLNKNDVTGRDETVL